MAVNPSLLATQIVAGIGQSSVTTQVTGFATGILDELTQNGIAVFGVSPTGNTITGLSGSSMASRVAAGAGYGSVSPELMNFCTGIVTHILTATVTYTGPTPPSEPAWFLGGTIVGLSGPAMAALVQASVGYPNVSSQLQGMCSAICDHITANAEVTSGVIS